MVLIASWKTAQSIPSRQSRRPLNSLHLLIYYLIGFVRLHLCWRANKLLSLIFRFIVVMYNQSNATLRPTGPGYCLIGCFRKCSLSQKDNTGSSKWFLKIFVLSIRNTQELFLLDKRPWIPFITTQTSFNGLAVYVCWSWWLAGKSVDSDIYLCLHIHYARTTLTAQSLSLQLSAKASITVGNVSNRITKIHSAC
jgi:hypothetical protein